VLFVCLVVVSCGKKEDSTTKVPESTNPDQTTTTAPAPTLPTPTVDPRLPDMTGSVSVKLTDKVNYTALSDLAGNVFLPIVGDAKVVMHLPQSRATSIYGDILFGFEDNQGFWGAKLPSFDGTGSLKLDPSDNITKLDMIFADDEMLFHVVGSLSKTSDLLAGSIYYRLRQTNDPKISFTLPNSNGSGSSVQSFPYCTKIEFKCTVTYPVGYTGPTGTNNSTVCPNQPVIDTATPCKTFMSITDSAVKKLGTFETKYTNWTTLKENE